MIEVHDHKGVATLVNETDIIRVHGAERWGGTRCFIRFKSGAIFECADTVKEVMALIEAAKPKETSKNTYTATEIGWACIAADIPDRLYKDLIAALEAGKKLTS
jgi:hypothetical protein